MSLNNPHKTKKSTRVGLRNIQSEATRVAVAKRRFNSKSKGLGYLAACDFLGEPAKSFFTNLEHN